MEYFDIIFQEVYKILFLLVTVLVSVAMNVWLDTRVLFFFLHSVAGLFYQSILFLN